MEISFKSCVPCDPSAQAKLVSDLLLTGVNDHDFLDFLSTRFSEDFDEMEDLQNWSSALTRLTLILRLYGGRLPNFKMQKDSPPSSSVSTSPEEDLDLVIKALKFLSILMKAGRDKRYFLAYEEVDLLLHAENLEVVILAIEVVFHVCVPTSSFSNTISDDWVDSIEVPHYLASSALTIFRSLSLQDQAVGIVDYLNGNESPSIALHGGGVDLSFPTQSSRSSPAKVHLDGAVDLRVHNINEIAVKHGLSEEETWIVALASHLVRGLLSDLSARVQIMRLRMLAFYILIHARMQAHELQDISEQTLFLTELVAIADVGSETMSLLKLSNPFDLAHVAIEIILGLLESKLRRRNSSLIPSNILQLLDLERGASSNSGRDCWINIVTSACSLGGLLFDRSSPRTDRICSEIAYLNYVGRFARLGLELFALALNTREPHHVVVDVPLIAVISSMLTMAVSFLRISLDARLTGKTYTAREVQCLLVVAKALYCLELTLDKNGYYEAFQESECLQVTMSIILSFSGYSSDQMNLLFDNASVRSVLDSALSVLYLSIQKSREIFPVMANSAATTAGVRMVQDIAFMKFGTMLFGAQFVGSELIWGQYIAIIRGVIDLDPAFLSQFLVSDCATALSATFSSKALFICVGNKGDVDLEKVLVPLARLAVVMCITNEGKQYVDGSKMVDFILEATCHSLSILPQSLGIASERLAKIGKLLAQVLTENSLIRGRIRDSLRQKIRALATDAANISQSGDVDGGTTIASSRMQVLQQLCNICTVVENMFGESRRQPLEAARDILTDELPALFGAYRCTLPSHDQLLAQLSVRSATTLPHLGHGASAKAITGLLKAAISISPQTAIPIILKEIEETLTLVENYSFLLASEEMHGAVQTPFASMLGILDSIPHICISDPQCNQFFENKIELKSNLCKFLRGSLHLEWLVTMLSHALRFNQRSAGYTALLASKDVFTKLSYFYRFSLLEVSRFTSSRLTESMSRSGRSYKTIIEALASCEGETNDDILREAGCYHLRVTGYGGALVREGIEIENSRVVFVAEVGTELVAHERRANAAGLIRYRTDLGWISEYRRDHQRNAIVEILAIDQVSDAARTEELEESSKLFSLREACSFSLTRVHASVRQSMIYMSRNMSSDQPIALRSNHFSEVVRALSSLLSEICALVVSSPFEETEEAAVIRDKVDWASYAFYLGTVAKSFILPMIEDKNGGLNILLLMKFGSSGVLKTLMESLQVISQILQTSEDESASEQKNSQNSRCAFYALSMLLPIIRKLINRDHYNKYTAHTDPEENVAELLVQVFAPLCDQLVPAFEKILWVEFPSGIQYELLQLLGEYASNANKPILLPRESSGHIPSYRSPSSSLNDRLRANTLRSLRNQMGPFVTPPYQGVGAANAESPTAPLPQHVPISANRSSNIHTPPPPADFVPSNDVVETLVRDLCLDRDDVVAVMHYVQSNDVDQIAELMMQGDSSEVIAQARARMPPAVPPVFGESAEFEVAVAADGLAATTPADGEDSSTAMEESLSPYLPLGRHMFERQVLRDQQQLRQSGDSVQQQLMPPPPPPPDVGSSQPSNDDGRGLNRAITRLPDLLSSLGIWDSEHDPPAAGIGAHEMIDALLHPAQRSRGSNSAHLSRTSVAGSNGNDMDRRGDVNPLEVDAKRIQSSVGRITRALPSYMVELCGKFETLQQREKRRIDYLIHQLCDIIVKHRDLDREFSINNLLHVLLMEVGRLMDRVSSSVPCVDAYSYLLLLTVLLRSPVHFKLDTDASSMLQAFVPSLLAALSSFVQGYPHTHLKLPSWISSAIIFLLEYFRSSLFREEYAREQLSAVLAAIGEEKEEAGALRESKDERGSLAVDHSLLYSLRRSVFDCAVDLLLKVDEAVNADICLALAMLLTDLIGDAQLASFFVQRKGLEVVFRMKCSEVKSLPVDKVLSEMLSTLISSPSEIVHELSSEIRNLFKKENKDASPFKREDTSMPLDKLLKAMSPALFKHPREFIMACQEVIKFTKCKTDQGSAEQGPAKALIVARLVKELDSKMAQTSDEVLERAILTFHIVVKQALAAIPANVDQSGESPFFSLYDCISSMGDALLSVKKAPVAICRVLESSDLRNFLPLVLDRLSNFGTEESSAIDKQMISVCTRFVVILSAFKGPSRFLALKEVMKLINHLVGELQSSDAILSRLSRLLSLLLLMIQSSKNHSKSVEKKNQQGVSVDAVYYLLHNEKLLSVLSKIMFAVSSNIPSHVQVFQRAIELAELVSRPKVLQFLDVYVSELQQNQSPTLKTSDSHIVDEMVDLATATGGASTSLSNDQHPTEHDLLEEDHGIVEDQLSSEESESEEDEEDEDEDDVEEDENEDEHEHEERGFDAEPDLRDSNPLFAGRHVEFHVDEDEMEAGDDSYVNVDSSVPASDPQLLSQFMGSLAGNRVLDLQDFNLPGASMLTPPDARMNEFQSIMQELSRAGDGDDYSLDRVAELARMLAGPSLHGNVPQENTAGFGELLPQGLQGALEINPERVNHPMLEASSIHNQWNALADAARLRPVNQTPSIFQVNSSGGTGYRAILRLPPNPAFPSPFEAYGLPSPPPELNGIPLQAMWPSVGRFGAAPRPSNVRTETPTPNTDIIDNLQRIVENYLTRELEVEEVTEEASQSQSTATFASRGAPLQDGVSLSLQSMQAVQDPNPRTNPEEESVRGGPIPPLIEFDSPDQEEGNEEMSVLTLPQEEAGAANDAINFEEVSHQIGRREEMSMDDNSTLGRTATPLNPAHELDNDDVSLTVTQDGTASHGEIGGGQSVDASGGIASGAESYVQFLDEAVVGPLPPVEEDEEDSISGGNSGDNAEEGGVNDDSENHTSSAAETNADVANADNDEPRSSSSDGTAGGALRCPAGYDADVFYSLPVDMQREIIEQYGETEEQLRELAEAAGYDYETIMSLPDNIRQEVLEQARRERGLPPPATTASASNNASSGPTQENDNMTFLASLSLELRAEVLLTADAEFLATLPPEVVAEAQALRERAANNFQRRELMQRVMRTTDPTRAAQPGDEPGLLEHGTFDFDGDDDDLDGEDEVYIPRRGRRMGFSVQANNDSGRQKHIKGSCFIISAPAVPQTHVPSKLLVATAKGLIIPTKQPSAFTATLLRAGENLCFSIKLKDSFFRLLAGLYVHDKSLVNIAMRELSHGKIDCSVFAENQSSITASRPIVSFSEPSSGSWQLSSVASQRILYVLNNLCSSNAAFNYLLLAERSESGEIVDLKVLNHNKEGNLSNRESPQKSSNSLVELFLHALPRLLANTRTNELEALMALVEQATQPLEHLDRARSSEDNEAADTSMVSIPFVVLSRDALSEICDALLSDACSPKIFSLITGTIARLAKIRTNCQTFTELLHDVVTDLADQVEAKLSSFHHHLCLSGTTEQGGVIRTLCLDGQSNSQQYDRLLRLLQTLQFVADRSEQVFEEIIPFDSLGEMSSSLESVLAKLKTQLTGENSEHNPADESNRISPQQTFLASTLRAILPVIESFFITFGSDVVCAKPSINSSNDRRGGVAPSANSQTPEAIESKKETPSLPSAASDPTSFAQVVAQALANTPGCKYRNTSNYQRANVSILNTSETTEEGRLLRRQSSLSSAAKLSHNISLTSSLSILTHNLSAKHARLLSFVQSNQSMLNLLIRSKPGLLDGSLSVLTRVVQFRSCLAFENKRKFFFSKLRRLQRQQRRTLHLQIRRTQVFEDTFHQLRSRTADEMRGRLQINFYNEEGVDAGGLTREWYTILSREIFNPNYALFMATADGTTFQPNPVSFINSNHLDYFKIVGRVIGKAICDGQLMDAHFTRSFYKHVLGLPIDFSDIEATEPDYYKNLRLLLEHPLDQLGLSGTTFTAEIQKFGRTEDIDLIPNGSNIAVTEDNKWDYVRLVAHHRMTSAISSQIDAFLAGFYDLIPPELVCIFSPAELELLICGLPDVDVDELQANTEYHQYRQTDDMVKWFWSALRSFSREERASFLQFVTGTSKVPLGGFSQLQGMRGTQKFSIHRAYGGENGLLPTAHTCYNQLDLPVYQSEEELRDKLLLAVREGSEGFGFA